jgi:hypothetical protein
MRPESITVNPGEYSFTIRPFTLGQIRKILKVLQDPLENFERSMRILEVALERDYPDQAKTLEDLVIPFDEFDSMATKVLLLAGFRKGDEKTGE